MAGGGEGDHSLALLGTCHDLVEKVGVEVDDGDRGHVEDLELALEVVLEVGVLDRRDVVAPDVEEAGDAEVEAEDAIVLQTLARHLHGHVLEAGLVGVVEVSPEVGGLGRGVVALLALDAVKGLDAAENARVLVGLIAVENGAEHVGDRRLALGPGDADDLDLVVGAVKGLGGGVGHGRPQVGAHERGHARRDGLELVGVLLVAEVGDCPLPQRDGEVLGLERPPLADEDVTGAGNARVAVDARDGRLGVLGSDVARGREEALLVKELDEGCKSGIHAAKYIPLL